ncbi:calcium-binding protein [Citrobacter sp. Marseille-Q6884]|uniref:calcium-binding protein n=1 Tax=Citrobacter sp. Marseille-Q6884 TaxID=2956786 RepID=UPI0021B263B7|nr:calcium-binding protein [Citrobacter sp. Marseille-Q6884]
MGGPDPLGPPADARSPIILDLDGDGIETTSSQNYTFFDHDGNGFAENTGWVGKDDGLLVLDRNDDGNIDTGSELFGNNTRLINGKLAQNGYEALKDLDENQDGLINNLDSAWQQLKVWQDKNGNGQVDESELLSLDEVSVAEITTGYQSSDYVDAQGNAHKQTSTITMDDGSVHNSADVWFNINNGITTYDMNVVISKKILELPYIRGFGNMPDLYTAMTHNPELQALVERYVADPRSAESNALLDEIIFIWAGVFDVPVNSRGGNIDARHLAAIEVAAGVTYKNRVNGSVDPYIDAAMMLEKQYDEFAAYIEASLLAQTLYAEEFSLIKIAPNAEKNGLTLNFDAFESRLAELKKTDYERFIRISEVFNNKFVYAPQFNEVRERIGISENITVGTDNIDSLYGNDNADYLWGGVGDDSLSSGNGNDILVGGKGNDYLVGNYGSDTYLFNAGDGQDWITEKFTNSDDIDRLIFSEGLLAENAVLQRSGSNLLISFRDSTDSVTLDDYFFCEGHRYRVEEIAFADGTVWNVETVKAMLIVGTNEAQTLVAYSPGTEIHGAGGDDYLKGDKGADRLYGDEGNDSLIADSGNDLLAGGTGNDYLEGGYGSDTYLFNAGDGQDWITEKITNSDDIDRLIFGEGLLAENAILQRSGSNLLISFRDSTDSVTLDSYFFCEGNRYRVEEIVFADGTVWNVETVKAMLIVGTNEAQTLVAYSPGTEIHGASGDDYLKGDKGADRLYGDEGNDSLIADSGNDLLAGGAGNDYLEGYYGSDTYLFNIGDGQDWIKEHFTSDNDVDRLIFGEGLLAENAILQRSGDNLLISFRDSADSVTLDSYFFCEGNRYRVEEIVFADGTVWDIETVKAMLIVGTDEAQTLVAYSPGTEIHGAGGDDYLKGDKGADHLYGDEGNDSLVADSGNDLLAGGAGNDYLEGYYGSDTYLFNIGDGQDWIKEQFTGDNDVDRLILGEGLLAENAILQRSGSNLLISFRDSADSVTLDSYFFCEGNRYRVEEIVFADGTVWDIETVKAMLIVGTDEAQTLVAYSPGTEIHGAGGDDYLKGDKGADRLYGDEGNDSLIADSGNDLLAGGAGNDYLEGYYGSDTYLFNIGDGQDWIKEHFTSDNDVDRLVLGEGISQENILLRRNGNNLVVTFRDSTDTVTLDSFFYIENNRYRVDEIVFADGTVWDTQKMKEMALVGTEAAETLQAYSGGNEIHGAGGNDTLRGYTGADKLYGDEGNDTLTGDSSNDELHGGAGDDLLDAGTGDDLLAGGAGNDNLKGGSGSDTYLFNAGDSQDSITEGSSDNGNIDTLRFGEGLLAENAILQRSGNNLVISFKGCDDQVTIVNYISSVNNQIEQIIFADGTAWDVAAVESMLLAGTEDDQKLVAFVTGSEIHASGGDDTLTGSDAADKLYGDDGNDTLNSGYGNDELHGGTGNDNLNGGTGSDTYLFNAGDGQDWITENSTYTPDVDRLVLGEGISQENILLRRNGNNLVVTFRDSTDTVTLADFYYKENNRYRVDEIVFADGTVWDTEKMKEMALVGTEAAETLQANTGGNEIHGAGGDDTLRGFTDADKLYGDEGNDTLTGDGSNDELHGGTGNDNLNGGTGSDTYLFNAGDGQDWITENFTYTTDVDRLVLGEGISQENILLRRNGNNLVVTFRDSTDTVTLADFYYKENNRYRVDEIVFADGTVWDTEKMKEMALVGTEAAETLQANTGGNEIHGAGGDDTLRGFTDADKLYGDEGNDTLTGDGSNDELHGGAGDDLLDAGTGDDLLAGGAGNDSLKGGSGSDTYFFNSGDGQDSITEGSSDNGNIDTLRFGEALQAENAIVQRKGNNLVITFAESTDSVTISDFFYSARYQVEHITFADGTDWQPQDILNHTVDNIPLPISAPADTPVPLQCVREQMAAFMASDDGDEESSMGNMPVLSTSRTSPHSLMHM